MSVDVEAGETAEQRLLDRLAKARDADGHVFALLTALQTIDQQRDFARDHAIDLPWISALCGLESMVPGSFARLATLAGRPEPEQRALLHRLIAAFWRDSALGLRDHVMDPLLQARCEEAVALHEQAAARQPVDRASWRRVRSALGQMALPTVQGRAAATIAAGCWDVDAIPTVFMDVMGDWRSLIQKEIDVHNGWDAGAEQAKDMAMVQAAIAAAAGTVPDDAGPSWKDSDEGKEYSRRMQEALHALHENPPAGYGRRTTAIFEAVQARFDTLADVAASVVGSGPPHG